MIAEISGRVRQREIRQVLSNLIGNAIDAMTDKQRRIFIRSRGEHGLPATRYPYGSRYRFGNVWRDRIADL